MAAVQPTVQFPQAYDLVGPDGKLTYQWWFFFQQLLKALPPIGASGVTTTTAPMNMAWGLDINKGVPTAGNVYLAYDTGKVYIGDGSTYHVEFPAITGDATKPVGSEVLTLNTVNYSPGTYGDGFNIPVVSVNAKGLVTNITLEPVSAGAVPAAGSTGMVQFNNAGNLAASGSFTYSISGDQLSVTNLLVHGNLQMVTFSPNAFTYSNATNQLKSTASATNGQLLIGGTGLPPLPGTLTAGTGISITNGPNSITIDSTVAPAPPDTSVQFNNGGVFGGSANLTWDGTKLDATEVEITGASYGTSINILHRSKITMPMSPGSTAPGFLPDRAFLQNNEVNQPSVLSILPNGTSQDSRFQLYNSSGPLLPNANSWQAQINTLRGFFGCVTIGSAPILPMLITSNGFNIDMAFLRQQYVMINPNGLTSPNPTTATEGFVWFQATQGRPTGTVSLVSGPWGTANLDYDTPLQVDVVDNQLYFYSGVDAEWKTVCETFPTVSDVIPSSQTQVVKTNKQYIVSRALIINGIILNSGTIVIL